MLAVPGPLATWLLGGVAPLGPFHIVWLIAACAILIAVWHPCGHTPYLLPCSIIAGRCPTIAVWHHDPCVCIMRSCTCCPKHLCLRTWGYVGLGLTTLACRYCWLGGQKLLARNLDFRLLGAFRAAHWCVLVMRCRCAPRVNSPGRCPNQGGVPPGLPAATAMHCCCRDVLVRLVLG